MNNFGRALLHTMRHRVAIAGIVLTSLLIASLWGTNIATLGPLVRIVLNDGQNLPSYASTELSDTKVKIAELDDQIDANKAALAASDDSDQIRVLTADLQSDQTLRDAYQESAEWLAWSLPYLNEYAPQGTYATLVAIIGVLIIGTAIKLVAMMMNMMMVHYVTERTTMSLRATFFRKSLHLDLDQFGDNGSAGLTSRLTNDISVVGGGIGVLLGRALREPLKLVACLAGAAYMCWRLLLVVMVVSPLVIFLMHHLSRAIRRAGRRSMEEMSQLYGVLNDSFAGIRIVRAFNTQAVERAKFQTRIRSYFRKSMKMAFYNSLARSTTELVGMTVIGMAVLVGGYLVVNQQTHLFGLRMSTLPLDQTQIILFFGFLIGATDPAKKLTDVWSSLQNGIAASNRVFEIIDKPTRVNEPADPIQPARPHQKITFRDISYQYSAGPQVLKDLNLTIRHGETVAIVGPNGCGKSTLISLLCRFDDPQQGQVLLDDTSLDAMGTRDLRKRLAIVTQRTMLFDDTIENNIRYGSPSADSHDVVRAAKMAFADDFIRRKTSHGYQTQLGTGGSRLSGGQMQRIALARAFLRNPDILILDEATSQIDLESEQLIHQALGKFLIDRTGIMITHRTSTLALADRIIVMESGEVSGQGEHSDLVQTNRFYQSLCGPDLKRAA